MTKAINTSIIILVFLSCTKVENKNQLFQNSTLDQLRQSMMTEDSATVYNYVLINSKQVMNLIDSNYVISAMAGFKDSITNNNSSVSSVYVNTRSLSKIDSVFSFGYSDSVATLSEGKALAGTNVTVKVTGHNPGDTQTQLIYMPTNIARYVSDFPKGKISNLNNLVLNWTPDASNPSQTVVIEISYYSGLTRSYEPSLPTSINTLTYIVPDNGSYTVSSSALQTFPEKSYINVSIGRGSQYQGLLPISQRRVFYWAISSVSTPPVYIETNASVNGYNTKSSNYNLRFTNNATGIAYNFLMQHNTTFPYLLGKVPLGTYTVLFYPAGTPLNCTFTINGSSQSGTGATFNNVSITGNSTATVN